MTRRWWLLAVWTVPSIVLLLVTAIVYRAYRITPPERLDAGERARVMATLRAALNDTEPPPCEVHRAATAVAVTVWSDGRTVVRVDSDGSDLANAVDEAAVALRARPLVQAYAANGRAALARIQVDVISGHAPLGDSHWLLGALALPGVASLLALNPGVDGIGAESGGRTARVLPHELVMAKLLSTKRPSETMGDFAMGVDLDRIASLVGSRLGRRVTLAELYRFRTDTFVEQPLAHRAQPPLALYRGVPPPPPLSSRTLREAALAGAHYLVAHLAPNGRYVYEHDLTTGWKTDPLRASAYSMPRHAGTTYFLARDLPDHQGGVAARADRARVRAPRRPDEGRRLRDEAGRRYRRRLRARQGRAHRPARLDRAGRGRARRVPARDRRSALPAARDQARPAGS